MLIRLISGSDRVKHLVGAKLPAHAPQRSSMLGQIPVLIERPVRPGPLHELGVCYALRALTTDGLSLGSPSENQERDASCSEIRDLRRQSRAELTRIEPKLADMGLEPKIVCDGAVDVTLEALGHALECFPVFKRMPVAG